MNPREIINPVKAVDSGFHLLDCNGIAATSGELIVEEPLLITIGGKSLATLMCTPGDELSLALGYLLTEGIIHSQSEIGAMAFCREESGNVVQVLPAAGIDFLSRREAHRTVFSSCSICGKEAIQAMTSHRPPFDKPWGRISPEAIFELGECLNANQQYFHKTGGTHAAVLALIKGKRLHNESAIVKEDIGRHNALDKAVGEALRRKLSFADSILFLSGRISFEMVAKAARAGISDLAAISAPTALAVELARKLGMFLAGFARGQSAVVYSGREALMLE